MVKEVIQEVAQQLEPLDNEFKSHHGTFFTSGGKFELYLPAYRMGADLYANHKDWADAEQEGRVEWNKGHPNTWDKFKDAIRYGWDRARKGRASVMRPASEAAIVKESNIGQKTTKP